MCVGGASVAADAPPTHITPGLPAQPCTHGVVACRTGQCLGPEVRELPVFGVGDRAARRLTRGIADEQHRVPLLPLLGDERGVAVAGVEDLAAGPGQEGLREGSRVPRLGRAAALGEPEQVQHHHGTARVLLEEAPQVDTTGIHGHAGMLTTRVARQRPARLTRGAVAPSPLDRLPTHLPAGLLTYAPAPCSRPAGRRL